jgi:Lon protease-like protein
VNVLLQTILLKNFPEEYKARRVEVQQQIEDHKVNLPLFIIDLVLFPNMALPLHVFEPRYRLMLRRCLEGGRRFGVVPVINNELVKVGTTAVIDNHVKLPDGRSLVSTRGEKRFRILDSWAQDGYMVAKVEYLHEDESSTAEDNEKSTTRLLEELRSTLQKKLAVVMKEVQEKYGDMPSNDAEAFSYWLAALLPVSTAQKQALLEVTSTLKRLLMEKDILEGSPNSVVSCVIA